MKPMYTFGPTTSYNRWIIHEIATEYGCTSRSHGVEPDRYTVVSFITTKKLYELLRGISPLQVTYKK